MDNDKRSLQTRKKILSAALTCFADNGYEGTGVAEICKAANISKGGFYHHFESKHAVFLSLLNNWLTELDQSMEWIVLEHNSITGILMEMSGLLQSMFTEESMQLPLYLEFWRHACRDKDLCMEVRAPFERYENYFAELIQKGIENGELEAQDPHLAAEAVISLAIGIVFQGMLNPSAKEIQATAHSSVDIMLKGLIKR